MVHESLLIPQFHEEWVQYFHLEFQHLLHCRFVRALFYPEAIIGCGREANPVLQFIVSYLSKVDSFINAIVSAHMPVPLYLVKNILDKNLFCIWHRSISCIVHVIR